MPFDCSCFDPHAAQSPAHRGSGTPAPQAGAHAFPFLLHQHLGPGSRRAWNSEFSRSGALASNQRLLVQTMPAHHRHRRHLLPKTGLLRQRLIARCSDVLTRCTGVRAAAATADSEAAPQHWAEQGKGQETAARPVLHSSNGGARSIPAAAGGVSSSSSSKSMAQQQRQRQHQQEGWEPISLDVRGSTSRFSGGGGCGVGV